MSSFSLTRRAALAALGAVVFPGLAEMRSALAKPGLRIRTIRVDVSPIRASMGDPTAAWVQEALPGALAQALAPYMAPGDRNGATLVARIDYLYLGPSSGGPGFFRQTQDTINGTLLVKGPRGGVLASVPLRAISSYFPMAVDQALVERALQGRVISACAGVRGLGAKGAGSLNFALSGRSSARKPWFRLRCLRVVSIRLGASAEGRTRWSPAP